MKQPLLNSVRSGPQMHGAVLGRKARGLWLVVLAMVCLLGASMPSQAQGFFTISQSPANGGRVTEGSGGTTTILFRIQLFGGVGGQTYRIFYQAQAGPVDNDPSKPPATAVTGCNAFSLNDFDGNGKNIDFQGNQANNFKDVSITVNSDLFDEGASNSGSPYFSQEFFTVILQSSQNVSQTPVGQTPGIGSDPDPAVQNDNDRVEAIIVDDDLPPILTVRQIGVASEFGYGPETLPVRNDGFNDRDYPDSFYPEGNSGQNNTVRFYVTGDQVSGKQIQFRWRTFNGTATANADYTPQDQIVTVAPNATISKLHNRFTGDGCDVNQTATPAVPLTVPILGDNSDETNETIVVDISPDFSYPINATVTPASAPDGTSGFATSVTILDDDAPSVSITDTQVTETDAGTTNATLQVRLSNTSPQAVRVDYVTDLQFFRFNFLLPSGSADPDNYFLRNGLPADFQYSVGSVTFQPGETTKFITIKVLGDTTAEGESGANRFETFPVDLFIGNNGNNTQVSFSARQPNELSDLNYTLGVNIADSQGIVQINDDDPLPQLFFEDFGSNSSGDVQVTEPDLDNNGTPVQTTANYVVKLSQASGLPISVEYTTSDGTAIDGANEPTSPTNPADYQQSAETLIFQPGEIEVPVYDFVNDPFGNTIQRYGIPIFGDNVDERDETFFVNLANPVNATILDSQAQATILDNDGPFIVVNGGTINGVPQDNVTAPEGDTGTTAFNFTVQLSAPSPQTVTVQLNTSDGSAVSTGPNPDYVPLAGQNQTLTFLPGETSKIVTVNVNGDIADERNETFTLTITSATNAQDPNAVGGNGDSQAIGTIVDDDPMPSIIISDVTTASLTPPGEGDAGTKNLTFTVQLSAPTFQDVSFNYATANGTATLSDNDYLARNGQLVISAGLTTQSFTVPIVGDTKKEADETFTVTISNVVNANAASTVSDLQATGTITNDDADPAGVTITPSSLTTSESGNSATFTVRLNRQPTADVTLQFTSNDTSEGLLSTGNATPAPSVTLTFTQQNYASAQTVRVTGQDDTLVDGDVTYLVNSETAISGDQLYQGFDPSDVVVTNTDDEVPGFQVTPASLNVSETGTTATFTVRLNVAPTNNVTIAVSSSDTGEATVSPATLTFTPANGTQPQMVTVTGVDDALRDGDQLITIVLGAATSADNRYQDLDPQDVTVTVVDNETPGILVTPISGLETTEAGGTATFTIQLTSPPSAPVSIALSSSDTKEGTVTPTVVTFNSSNFNQPQTITVTGKDDVVDDGDVAYKIITAGATSADTDYNNLNPSDVDLINLDDEVPGFIVTPNPLTVNENAGTFSFTVRLATVPTGDVTVPVVSERPSVADVTPTTLTFTQANFSVPQTVRLTITDNRIDDGDKDFNIRLGVTNSSDTNYDQLSEDIPITVVDNDTAGIVVAPTGNRQTTEATGAGRTTIFTIKLNSAPTSSVTIALSSSNPSEGTVSPASVTFDSTNFDTPQQVTVTGVDDDVDDGNVTYFIRTDPAQSSDANYNGMNAVDVAVTSVDNDTFGITINPTSGLSTKERGQSANFTVVLTSQPLNTVNFTLTSSDTTEGVPGVARVFFTPGNWNVPQTVTVRPVDDLVDDDDQPYTIVTGAAVANGDSKYNGFNPVDVQLTNIDDDTAGLFVRPNSLTSNGLFTTREDGARVSFSVRLLSQPTSNVTVNVTTTDPTEGVASPTSLTFTPASYNTLQTFFVSGVDDTVEDGHINYTINVASTVATGGDAKYSGQSVPSFAARNLDNDDTTKPNVAITSPTANQVFRSITRVSGTASDAKDPASFFVSGVVRVEVQLVRYDDPTTPASEVGYYNSDTGQFELPRNTATTDNPQLLPATYNASRQAWVANLPQTGTNSLAEGSYAVVAYATDGKGNRQDSTAVKFRVDMTPPVVAITTPADGATLNTLPQARGTATDVGGSGINRVEVTVIRQANNTNGLTFGYLAKDGSFTSTFTVANNRLPATLSGSNWTVNLPTLPRATYTITAYAFDNGGLGSAPDTHRFNITGTNEFAGNTSFLISIPYMDGAGVNATTTPTKAFTIPPTDPTTGRVNYRLQRYNPLTMDWETLGNGSTLRRGEGYLLTPVASGVSIKRPSDDPTRIPLDSSVQEFQVTLRNQPSLAPDADGNGWNLIGDPFNPALFSSAEWLTARVTANIGGQTFTGTVAEAADRGILDRRLFNYNPSAATSGGSLYTPVTGNLLPFRGYFVRTFVDGVQVNLRAVPR